MMTNEQRYDRLRNRILDGASAREKLMAGVRKAETAAFAAGAILIMCGGRLGAVLARVAAGQAGSSAIPRIIFLIAAGAASYLAATRAMAARRAMLEEARRIQAGLRSDRSAFQAVKDRMAKDAEPYDWAREASA